MTTHYNSNNTPFSSTNVTVVFTGDTSELNFYQLTKVASSDTIIHTFDQAHFNADFYRKVLIT